MDDWAFCVINNTIGIFNESWHFVPRFRGYSEESQGPGEMDCLKNAVGDPNRTKDALVVLYSDLVLAYDFESDSSSELGPDSLSRNAS